MSGQACVPSSTHRRRTLSRSSIRSEWPKCSASWSRSVGSGRMCPQNTSTSSNSFLAGSCPARLTPRSSRGWSATSMSMACPSSWCQRYSPWCSCSTPTHGSAGTLRRWRGRSSSACATCCASSTRRRTRWSSAVRPCRSRCSRRSRPRTWRSVASAAASWRRSCPPCKRTSWPSWSSSTRGPRALRPPLPRGKWSQRWRRSSRRSRPSSRSIAARSSASSAICCGSATSTTRRSGSAPCTRK
mmetsp:Transcript_82250/g.266589  ORF Transcript_82250/g.266589 Transcript_82250/m.266589 type:complete len:243 (-) Transcript_82250:544-1272(-)